MHSLDAALSLAGLTVIALALVSGLLRSTVLQEPLVAFVVGMAAGPAVLGLLDLDAHPHGTDILREAARLTLAMGLMGIALRVRRKDLRALWRRVALVLLVGMPAMWLAGTAIVAAVLGQPLLAALVLAAAITPTDPVVATSITVGRTAERRLPTHLRETLSLEAGANDGLAYPMLMLPVLLLGQRMEPALATWLVDVLLHGAVVGVAAGAALGWLLGRAFHRAHERGFMEDYSMLTFTVALSLATLGTVSTIGGEGILGVFAAGIAFNLTTTSREQEEEEHVQEGVGRLFLQPVFFLFGIMAPLGAWWGLGAKGLACGLLILLFRRLPAFLAMYPLLQRSCSLADLAFLGWFGPLGVTTIYFGLSAADDLRAPGIWHAASLLVAVSLVAHGMTATPFSRWYAAHEQRGG